MDKIKSLKLWIARDKDNSLWLYKDKPIKFDEDTFDTEVWTDSKCWLDEESFPEVTWENSPQKVELKLIEE